MASEQMRLVQEAITVRTKPEADRIFRRLVTLVLEGAWSPVAEAEARVRSQLAYFAGYGNRRTRARVERLFGCPCPARRLTEPRLPDEALAWTYSTPPDR